MEKEEDGQEKDNKEKGGGKNVLWSGAVEGKRLTVSYRNSRGWMISLFLATSNGRRQLCSSNVQPWDKLANVFRSLAEEVSSGVVSTEACKPRLKTMLLDSGLVSPKKSLTSDTA